MSPSLSVDARPDNAPRHTSVMADLRLEPQWTGQARVAVAHDYLTQRGGAERVTLALLAAFPDAPLITSVYAPDATYADFAQHNVRTSWLQRMPFAPRDPRVALPLLPRAWKSVQVGDDIDVVVASSTGFAHGVRTRARKIVYCHNPPRWLYQRDEYLMEQSRTVRAGLSLLSSYLHRSDTEAAATADRYIANSRIVAQRIKTAYGIDAPVIFPPVTIDPKAAQTPVPGVEPGYFLSVARRRGYKNIVAACEAVQAIPGARLVVVGGLPPHPTGGRWKPGIVGVRDVSEACLRWLYANCEALIAPSFEDFGLTPIEAAAFGRPTVALRAGGYLDTVQEGLTGTFADEPTAESIGQAVETLRRNRFNPHLLRAHARLFGLPRFIAQMQQQVAEVMAGSQPLALAQ